MGSAFSSAVALNRRTEGSRKRSVLFLLPSLGGGGAERVLVTVVRYLDRTRFSVSVAVIDGRDGVYTGELPGDVEYFDMRCARVRYAFPAIIKLIWRRRPDVVVSNIMHLNLAVALMKPLLPRGTRVVARESSVLNASLPNNIRGRAEGWLYRRFYKRFDHVICQSESMRAEISNVYGVPRAATTLIRNPVDIDRVRSLAREPLPAEATLLQPDAPSRVRLVAAGRLAREKGFDILLDAIAMLPATEVSLTILGDGYLRNELQNKCRSSQLEDRVQFMGFRPNPYPFLASASAFVLSSRHESFPNVVLEALVCGTPVIATPAIGGVAEILRGQGGCVIAKEITAESLADAIANFQFETARHEIGSMIDYAPSRIVPEYAMVLQ